MREIASTKIIETVAALFESAAYDLPQEVEDSINHALAHEKSPLGRQIIREILKNAEIARQKKLPICQDTGMAVVFIAMGQQTFVVGGNLHDAVNDGVKEAYKNLRKSMVSDPFKRENTKDNLPASIHVEIVPGDTFKIIVLPKGGGAENASFQKMFLPTTSREVIEDYIVGVVKENGTKACPPLILGVGIGGAFDSVATLAKKSLLRPISSHSTNHENAAMEKALLLKINNLGLGPMGVGGTTTALAVHVESAPCHIASLPVAVNFQCHAHRYKEAIL